MLQINGKEAIRSPVSNNSSFVPDYCHKAKVMLYVSAMGSELGGSPERSSLHTFPDDSGVGI